ncbi:hypothetical protein QOT17_015606 [Balamuthia mandrillaris]
MVICRKEEIVQGICWQYNSNLSRRTWTKETVTNPNYWPTVEPKYSFASQGRAVEGRLIVVIGKDLKKKKVFERIFQLGLKHFGVEKKNGTQHWRVTLEMAQAAEDTIVGKAQIEEAKNEDKPLWKPKEQRYSVTVEAVNALGLHFNAKKSVVLVQGKKANVQEWRLKGEAMKRVKDVKYLGLWFEESGEWTTHAKERITKAKQALYSFRQCGAIAQVLGTHTAQIATEAIIKSTLSYGLCMTELSKSWWKKIKAVWNETARSVLQVHQRTVAGVCGAELN